MIEFYDLTFSLYIGQIAKHILTVLSEQGHFKRCHETLTECPCGW